MKNRGLLILTLAYALLFAGYSFGAGELPGTYINQKNKATLTVSDSQMASSKGPMTVTADYKIIKSSGNTITVELSAPQVKTKTIDIRVKDDSLDIDPQPFFGGHWERQ